MLAYFCKCIKSYFLYKIILIQEKHICKRNYFLCLNVCAMKPECWIFFLVLIIYFEIFVARFVLVVQAIKLSWGLCVLIGYTRLEVPVRNVPHLLMCF